MKVTLHEEKTFTVANGDKVVHGFHLSETWNGLERYVAANGDNMILSDGIIIKGNSSLLQALGIGRSSFESAFDYDLLKSGEIYAGTILKEDGAPDEHVILLPCEKVDTNWNDAQAWAKSVGGTLPTRREQSLLFANLKEHFQSRAYWSGERHAGVSSGAWGQHFVDGGQDNWFKDDRLCARAVRKLPI